MVHVMLVAKQAWASKTQPCMQMGGNELEEVLWLFEVVQWAMAEGGLGGMGRQHSCLHAVPKNEIWRGVSVSSFDARSSSTLQRRRSHTLSALLPSGSEIWEWTQAVFFVKGFVFLVKGACFLLLLGLCFVLLLPVLFCWLLPGFCCSAAASAVAAFKASLSGVCCCVLPFLL